MIFNFGLLSLTMLFIKDDAIYHVSVKAQASEWLMSDKAFKSMHSEGPSNKEICGICGKLIDKYNMTRHLDTHEATAKHKCHICKASYKDHQI